MTQYVAQWTTEQIASKANQWHGQNYHRWSNADYDAIYNQLRTETDPAKRRDLIIKANDLLVSQVVIGCFSAFFLGVYCTTLVELFPIRIRSTALAIVNNVAVLVFGGFAQFFVTWLIALTGSPLAPIFYVMIGVGLGLIAVIAMRPEDAGQEQVADGVVEPAS